MTMTLPSLMVLDGESRITLGIVRSLGRRGIPIMVGSDSPLGKSGFSRYAQERFNYNLKEGLQTAHQRIIEKVKSFRPDILMPTFNEGWSIVHSFFEEYSALTTLVPNPGPQLFERLSDKGYLKLLAEQHGVPIPKTLMPDTKEEVIALVKTLEFPVLFKPRRSNSGIGIQRVSNKDQLSVAASKFQDVPIIQEQIEGEDLEFTALCNHGEPLACSVYLNLRNAPLPYGPPVACRTVRDDDLMKVGIEFLKKIGYHGVAHLDFRRDKKDGHAKLLDFNPRLAGTNDVSIASGIDFALMLYRLAAGDSVSPIFDYELDSEFRWVNGELKHFAQSTHKGKIFRNWLCWRNVSTDRQRIFKDVTSFLKKGG
jgi:predicted ATP-grasp superfamily ATP-dependent carboligase